MWPFESSPCQFSLEEVGVTTSISSESRLESATYDYIIVGGENAAFSPPSLLVLISIFRRYRGMLSRIAFERGPFDLRPCARAWRDCGYMGFQSSADVHKPFQRWNSGGEVARSLSPTGRQSCSRRCARGRPGRNFSRERDGPHSRLSRRLQQMEGFWEPGLGISRRRSFLHEVRNVARSTVGELPRNQR